MNDMTYELELRNMIKEIDFELLTHRREIDSDYYEELLNKRTIIKKELTKLKFEEVYNKKKEGKLK